MRWKFTSLLVLYFFILVISLSAQTNGIDTNGSPDTTTARIRCGTSMNASSPLFVVDGIPQESISDLEPGQIKEIQVLKSASASAIYSCRPMRGVILITTRNPNLREFKIIDLSDGTPIPAATVIFIPTKTPADSLAILADSTGKIATEKLKPGDEYKVRVSSVGYESRVEYYRNASIKRQSFGLERKMVISSPVIVYSYSFICRKINIACGGLSIVKINSVDSSKSNSSVTGFKVYPNPAIKGSEIKIEADLKHSTTLQARILGLDGRILLNQVIAGNNGKQQLRIHTSSGWTAGIYFIQLVDDHARIISQEKILLQ